MEKKRKKGSTSPFGTSPSQISNAVVVAQGWPIICVIVRKWKLCRSQNTESESDCDLHADWMVFSEDRLLIYICIYIYEYVMNISIYPI